MKRFSLIDMIIVIAIVVVFAGFIVNGTIESTTNQDQHLEKPCQ